MPGRPLVRRRTAVAGALACGLGGLVSLAAGCDTGDDLPDPDRPDASGASDAPDGSAAPSSSGTSSAEPEQTPDQALVDAVLLDLVGALGVAAGARTVARLRRPVTALVRAHRQHILVLEGELPDTASPLSADLPALLHSERRLHARLVEAAGQAESGALAKLLASMSASVTQHLLVLPEEVAP